MRASTFSTISPWPPVGKPSWSMVSGVPRRSSVNPRTVVSPPAKKRSLAGSSSRTMVVPSLLTSRGKPVASPRRAPKTMTAERRPRQLPIRESLHECLDEPDLRSDAPGRQLGVDADQAPAGRLDRIVARVANQRRRHARETHLRKQPIDLGLRGEVRLDVQELRAVDAVAAADRQRRG